jgi:hypothetical protein
MGARTSAEMKQAIALVKAGKHTPAQAAREADVSESGLSRALLRLRLTPEQRLVIAQTRGRAK